MNPNYKWLKTSGIISPEKWGNLPGGEIFTTPGEVNGTFVIDGVVGDYLCAKFGSHRAELPRIGTDVQHRCWPHLLKHSANPRALLLTLHRAIV